MTDTEREIRRGERIFHLLVQSQGTESEVGQAESLIQCSSVCPMWVTGTQIIDLLNAVPQAAHD